jgi:hypothetical protein
MSFEALGSAVSAAAKTAGKASVTKGPKRAVRSQGKVFAKPGARPGGPAPRPSAPKAPGHARPTAKPGYGRPARSPRAR